MKPWQPILLLNNMKVPTPVPLYGAEISQSKVCAFFHDGINIIASSSDLPDELFYFSKGLKSNLVS